MNKRSFIFMTAASIAVRLASAGGVDQNGGGGPGADTPSAAAAVLVQRNARTDPAPDTQMLLAAARAGRRIVAVGDHGIVALSDDGGRSFRQARTVPTRVVLTGVSFADALHGWAVGHWGTILRTEDGGETWALQRTDTSVDRPLFAVQAIDASRALAVGLWSLALVTDDAHHWHPVQLPKPPDGRRADCNLLGAFSRDGRVYVPAERGLVLSSVDGGTNWTYQSTGYAGSLWAGIALRDGTLLVGGLRGTVYRSTDGGANWVAVDSTTRNSITGFAEVRGRILAVGLGGAMVQSVDDGASFSAIVNTDHTDLTAVIAGEGGGPVVFSAQGVVRALPRGAAE